MPTQVETIRPVDRVKAASTVLLPKNSNEEGANGWLKSNGLYVPDFPGRSVVQRNQGQTYRRLRDPDIVNGLLRGEAEVGFLGSDKFEELEPDLEVEWLGDVPNCDFVLAARLGTIATVEKRLERAEPVSVATSNPVWLGKLAETNGWELDIRAVSGSAEAYGDMEDMVADLRVTGRSLSDNHLHEFMRLSSVQLGLIYPPGEV